MRFLLPLLMVLACSLPAEARIRPFTFMKHTAALAVGVSTAPVTYPLHFWGKQYLLHKHLAEGNYHAARWMYDDKYRLFWVEDWWQ